MVIHAFSPFAFAAQHDRLAAMMCAAFAHSILSLKEKDAAELADLERKCFSSPWTKDQYLTLLREAEKKRAAGRQASWALWGIRNERKQLVAYISMGVYCPTAEMEVFNIAVEKSFRRMGLGRELLLHALHWGEGKGFEQIFLEVRESNAAALALYESTGFVFAGRRQSYYADTGEDALVLVRRLREDRHKGAVCR